MLYASLHLHGIMNYNYFKDNFKKYTLLQFYSPYYSSGLLLKGVVVDLS